MGEVGDEVDPVLFGVGYHIRLYQEIDGVDEGAEGEVIKRVNTGLFPVRLLFLFKESITVSHLRWC